MHSAGNGWSTIPGKRWQPGDAGALSAGAAIDKILYASGTAPIDRKLARPLQR